MPDPTLPVEGGTQPTAEGQTHAATLPGQNGANLWEQDLQELSPEKRDRIVGKIKGMEKGLHQKMNELTQRERDIAKVLEDAKAVAARPSLAEVRQEGAESLDALIQQTTDPAQKETLRQLKTFIRKESSIDEIQKKLDAMDQKLKGAEQYVQVNRFQSLTKEIDELDKRYGSGLVEKHRDQILSEGMKGTLPARKLLQFFADPDELEQALELQRRKSTEPEKKPKAPAPAVSGTQPLSPAAQLGNSKNVKTIQSDRKALIRMGVERALGLVRGPAA